MLRSKKAQASFEYLVTYGWALLAAVIAAGALAYFGFISPSNLLPNSCNFGKQLYCEEYQIFEDGTVNIMFRNNFAKPINITNFAFVEEDGTASSSFISGSKVIDIGSTGAVSLVLDSDKWKSEGQKQSLTLQINFTRSDTTSTNHVVYGRVFTVVGKS